MEQLLKKYKELAQKDTFDIYYEPKKNRYYFGNYISSVSCSYKKTKDYLYLTVFTSSSLDKFPKKKLLELFFSFWKEFGEKEKISFIVLELSYRFMVTTEANFIRSAFSLHQVQSVRELVTEEKQTFLNIPFGYVYEFIPGSFEKYLTKYNELFYFFSHFLKEDLTAHLSTHFSSLRLTEISYYYQGEENKIAVEEKDEQLHLSFFLNEKEITKEVPFIEAAEYFQTFFETRKKARRIVNHFNPPKRHFIRFMNKIDAFNYFPSVIENVHQEFLTLFKGDYQHLEETLMKLEKSKIKPKVYKIIEDKIHVLYLFDRCFILSTKGVNETFHSYTSCSIDEAEETIQKIILSLTSRHIKKDIQLFK